MLSANQTTRNQRWEQKGESEIFEKKKEKDKRNFVTTGNCTDCTDNGDESAVFIDFERSSHVESKSLNEDRIGEAFLRTSDKSIELTDGIIGFSEDPNVISQEAGVECFKVAEPVMFEKLKEKDEIPFASNSICRDGANTGEETIVIKEINRSLCS